MRDQEIKALLSGAFGADLIGVIRGGRDADRPYRFTIARENLAIA
ncbi:hypothetical protein ACTMU2_13780 [Cupriavidus basilensis]